jgi:hypothetical protein
MYGEGRLGASANILPAQVVAGIGDAGLNENAQRDVIPNESEGPLDYGVITQHLRDLICNCEVPRRLRLGMTGVSAQYRRHRSNLCTIISNESESPPINGRSSENCVNANWQLAKSLGRK